MKSPCKCIVVKATERADGHLGTRQGDRVKVIDRSGDEWRARRACQGFIPADCLEGQPPPLRNGCMALVKKPPSLGRHPNKNLLQVPAGETVQLLSYDRRTWAHAEATGPIGLIMPQHLKPASCSSDEAIFQATALAMSTR